MAPAWLDSLSEDWPSRAGSEASLHAAPSPLDKKKVANPSERASTPSRIPRFQGKPHGRPAAASPENSNVLSERSANDINVMSAPRIPSKLSREIKLADSIPPKSRSVSAATVGSVVHNTVHQTTQASSPHKKGDTPEWKRRLVYGDIAYGEQRDLFSSAGAGLENIFKPPQPPQHSTIAEDVAEANESVVERQNETTLPSSPPPYPEIRENNEQEPRQRKMRYALVEDFSIDPSSLDSNLERDRDGFQVNYEEIDDVFAAKSGEHQDRVVSRKISGQSDVHNEELSPIWISRRNASDGRVSFAPIELPAEQLRQRLEKLRRNQMLLDSDWDRESAAADGFRVSERIDTTDDYARNGGFLNLRRGGRSADGSFRERPLSDQLDVDTSEMFPEESLQASTPKQFPSAKSTLHAAQPPRSPRSPQLPLAPFPSPEKRGSREAGGGGSPLKLFGPYDTFTNQTLLRRISQFEDQNTDGSRRTSDDRAASVREEGEDQRTHPATGRATLNEFGRGSLDGYQFNKDMSFRSEDASVFDDDKENQMTGAGGAQHEPFRFDITHSSSPPEEPELLVRRRRPKTPGRTASSGYARRPSNPAWSQRPESRSKLLRTPQKRNESLEGKRPRTSPSKDPTPKRRRTLHKSDIAYGLEERPGMVESAQASHQQMQYIIGRKRKDARQGEPLQAANPNVLATRQIARPRTPTPSQRSSQRRDRQPLVEIRSGDQRTPENAKAETHAQAGVPMETERKPSIRTQDFLDEAEKIMAMIRSKARPQSGLASVEESEAENGGTHAGQNHDMDDSYQESTKEPFSRPPSRDGKPIPRMSTRQEDPELVLRLKRYEEKSDMGDMGDTGFSVRSLGVESQSGDGQRPPSSTGTTRIHKEEAEIFSDPPNMRITENPVLQSKSSKSSLGRDGADCPTATSQSSGQSTNRSIPTGSSRGSDSKKTIAPQSVSHLIPEQVGSMVFDRERNVWVKRKVDAGQQGSVRPDDSEEDLFASIPDLSVDMTKEMQALRLLTSARNVSPWEESGPPAPMDRAPTPVNAPDMPATTKSALSHDSNKPASTAVQSTPIRMSVAREETAVEDDEEIDHEITLHQDRISNLSPSRRRNLTITFSSPIASVIHDIPRADDDEGDRASPQPNQQTGPSQRRFSSMKGTRAASRVLPREVSIGGQTFIARPISRIEERDENSQLVTVLAEQQPNMELSVIGDRDVDQQNQGNMSVVVATPSPSRRPRPDTANLLPQYVGTLSLSPLSEITFHHGDQSYGFEVSYVMDGQHLVTGTGSKRVMSMTLRNLVSRLTEAEPSEPYWEDLRELAIASKQLDSLHMLDRFCGRLESLDASDNALSTLIGIPSSVRELKVTHNQLSSLTAWSHLMNLQYVDVSDNEIESLSPFKNLVHLRNLRADNNKLKSLDGILSHKGLQSLRARGNLIEHVDFEDNDLRRLTELDLEGNCIESVSNIDRLASLTVLNLARNRLDSFTLPPGRFAESLKYVTLSDNNLETLDVALFPHVRLLHVDRNSLGTIIGCERARRLDSLSLREQKGELQVDQSFLDSVCEVRKLYLSGNHIGSNFEPRVDFLNLQYLELANCGIQALAPGLGEMTPNLRVLNLNFNAIADVRPLRCIPRLKKLFIAGNRLAALAQTLDVLSGMPHLSRADMRDNPVTLGFYPPLQMLIPTGPDAQGQFDPFILPDADEERDRAFASRLDQATKVRRTLYELAVAEACEHLRMLDGLSLRRNGLIGVEDAVLSELQDRGLVEFCNDAPKGADEEAQGQECAGPKEPADDESSAWNAEDSFA